MSTSGGNQDSNREISLEEMSKEDLVKKCKRLMVLAQRAKQSKDESMNEIKLLKDQENQLMADMQKMIATITEKQKLNAELESEVLKLQKEADKVKSQVAEKIIENTRLSEKVQELEKRELEYTINEEKYAAIDKNLDEFKQKYLTEKSKYEELIQILNKKIEEKKESSKENLATIEENELEMKLREVSDLLKEETTQHEISKEKIKFLESENNRISQINTKLKSDFEELKSGNEEQLENIKKQLERLKMEDERLIIMAEKLEKAEQNSEHLEKIFNEHQKDYETCKKKSQAYDQILKELLATLNSFSELKKLYQRVKVDVDQIFGLIQKELQNGRLGNQINGKINHVLSNIKAELLQEMNLMNKELKERGETISKLEEVNGKITGELEENKALISKLEETNGKITKELQEELLRKEKKEKVMRELEEEITRLKNSEVADHLSTSTISKIEEPARIAELEEGFEEKYTKLKMLAGKLKNKCSNLQKELLELKNEREISLKKIHQFSNLQTEYDKLAEKSEAQLNLINDLKKDAEESKKLRETVDSFKLQFEKFQSEKSSFEIIKKELTGQISSLKKSLEKEKAREKELGSERVKHQEEIKIWEQRLEEECERHKQTLLKLDEQKAEVKKWGVLNLEMAHYEKTLNELTKKLNLKDSRITELESSLETQRELSKTLQESLKESEDNLNKEQKTVDELNRNLQTLKDALNTVKEELKEKTTRAINSEKTMEELKLQLDGLNLELALIGKERLTLEEARVKGQEDFAKQISELEDKISQQEETLEQKNLELQELKKEYESYKVRAQSVLRQKVGDVGNFNIQEELKLLKCTNEAFKNRFEEISKRNQNLEDENKSVLEEKNRLFKRVQELQGNLTELREQQNELKSELQREKESKDEMARMHKVQTDTLAQCYKTELEEMEKRHLGKLSEVQRELEAAKSSFDNKLTFQPVKQETLDVLLLEREACEGSESIELNSPNTPGRGLIPLDQLLSSNNIEESVEESLDPVQLASRLEIYQSRIQHLTELLSDAESDAARLQQLNNMLKDEIRRKERNEEREHHAHNLEYLKNVVVKFVTLPSGDERMRLVPVLNTILKLSPEELDGVNLAAKGRSVGAEQGGWGSYLSLWSGPSTK